MTTPERIWAWITGIQLEDKNSGLWFDWPPNETVSQYILATSEALAASPEVQALIAAERERCARLADLAETVLEGSRAATCAKLISDAIRKGESE